MSSGILSPQDAAILDTLIETTQSETKLTKAHDDHCNGPLITAQVIIMDETAFSPRPIGCEPKTLLLQALTAIGPAINFIIISVQKDLKTFVFSY